jgi:DegV family protein with EDD domain
MTLDTKIAVVTDSTADIPEDIANRYHIQVVPTILVIEGKSYEDGEDISREDYYNQLDEMETTPTTAAPSSGTFTNLYQKLFDNGYDQIISIHPPGILSGILNAAHVGAQEFNEKVYILDSGQVTLGMGFQVIEAAECVQNNLPLGEIFRRIYQVQERVKVVAMLDTLKYLQRSGRVSWARASLGSILRIKPFIELKEGRVLKLGEVRTRRKGINRLFQMLESSGPLERLAILHTNAESDAQQILNMLSIPVAIDPIIVNVTTVIGTHVGPNGLGFALVSK